MARRRKGLPIHGWLVFDKPQGLTSTQAVTRVRHLYGAAKAGHAGTLDPLATGVLPIAFGEATKTVPFAVEGSKQYRFTVRFGSGTDTDDAEGQVVATSDRRPTRAEIEAALPSFVGEISQVPPRYSALKVAGARAYDLARNAQEFELAPRQALVASLTLVDMPDPDHCVIEAECGKGTYVRSLARDMGRRLGCLGHVSMLRRIAVGPFGEADMIPLDKLEEMSHKPLGNSAENGVLRPLETVLDGIPAVALKDAEAQRLKQGQSILLRGANAPIACDAVLVTWGSKPLGICSIEQGSLKPKRLFNL